VKGYAFSLFSLLLSASAMSFDRSSSLTVLRLCYSLHLHPGYNAFRSELEKSLPLSDALTPSTTDCTSTTSDNAIDAALEVLRERKKVVEAEKNENLDDMGDGSTAQATDWDEGMVDEAGQPLAPVSTVDNALEILVDNAIEEFGFAPRDVYGGVLEPHNTRHQHANAVKQLDYTELQKTVRFFSQQCGLTDSATSHHVIVVFPRPHPTDSLLDHDRWAIDFKSIQIAKKVTESMRLQETECLWEMYQSFHRSSASSALAGWVFEVIVHCLFSGGWQSGPVLQPIRMDHNGSSDFPVFYADPSSTTPDTSSSPLRPRTRAVIGVNFTDCQLSDVMLNNGRYYIPTAAIHPLFDSFTIDMDPHTVVITFFRITVSPRNGGLVEGYSHVRKIMRHVHELLKETDSNAAVKFAYILVCPDDESEYQWQMSVGWNKDTETHDHRRDVFCIRVPVP